MSRSLLIATIICLTATGLANAVFISYNDCVYSAAQGQYGNTTKITTYNIGNNSPGPVSGVLKDYATGASTGITAGLVQTGAVVWQPGDPPSPYPTGGKNSNAGTDAANTFAGIVDMSGVTYYGSSGWTVTLTLSGLNPNMQYEFVTSANRGAEVDQTVLNQPGYVNRITKYTLAGVDASTNSSSTGTFSGATDLTSSFSTGMNTTNGYIARWTGINPGADGTITIKSEAANPAVQYKAYAFSVFKLAEVPEPATLSLLALGGLAMLRRRH